MAYATRNRALSLVFLAGCANEALSLLLKRVVRQPRPERRCTDLGTCGKFGMPSSHTQVSFFFLKDFFFSPLVLGFLSLAVLPRERRRDLFFFTIAIRKKGKIKIEKKKKKQSVVFSLHAHLLLRRRLPSLSPKSSSLPPFLFFLLEGLALALAAATVAWARVYLGYHSWEQVLVGAALGAAAALATARAVVWDHETRGGSASKKPKKK